MGNVVGNIKVNPTGVMEDDKLNKIIDEIKTMVKPPAKLGKITILEVAFGFRAINVTILIPDKAGGIDPIAKKFNTIENVSSTEVTDVGLL